LFSFFSEGYVFPPELSFGLSSAASIVQCIELFVDFFRGLKSLSHGNRRPSSAELIVDFMRGFVITPLAQGGA
jgi:hypothetical protein